MATKYFTGDSTARAKAITCTVANQTPGETFSISVGGVEIVSWEHTTGEGLDDIVWELAQAWNASTHPYATGVTASVGASGSGEIVLTADVAGWDFDVTPAVDLSSAATFEKSTTTTLKGPNHWGDGDNWWNASTGTRGTAPQTGDDVIIRESNVNLCWGLDQSAVTLSSLEIDETYTGKLGQPWAQFATSADGGTYSATLAREYRQCYLKIGATTVHLGKKLGTGASTASPRIKLHNTVQTNTTVHRTGASCADMCLAATRLLFDNASSNLFVFSAQKGVAVAADEPGETSSIDGIHVSVDRATDWVKIGDGVTLDHLVSNEGEVLLQAAGFVTTVDVAGGRVTTQNDFEMGTLNMYGGTLVANHVSSSSGNEIDTVNLKGGNLEFGEACATQTIGTLTPETGSITLNGHAHTVTVWNEPLSRRKVTYT